MVRFKMALITLISVTSTLYSQETKTSYMPSRYQAMVTKAISLLEGKKKTIATQLAQGKKRVAEAQKRQKNIVAQGNLTVIEKLQNAQAYIVRRLTTLSNEDKKIKSNTHGITNKLQEDAAIKKLTLQSEIEDDLQQIFEAKQAEQFFENQKTGKTQPEKDALENIRRSWLQKREKLELRKTRTESKLKNIK